MPDPGRRMLLATPATPNGVGITFSSTTRYALRRDADFLVLFDYLPRGLDMQENDDFQACCLHTTRREANATFTQSLKDIMSVHHRPTLVTPSSLGLRQHERLAGGNGETDVSDSAYSKQCSGIRIPQPTSKTYGLLPAAIQECLGREVKVADTATEEDMGVVVDVGRTLARLVGRERRMGPGPGGSLPVSSTAGPRNFDPHLPPKAESRRMVEFLEAELRTRKRNASKGLPCAPSQRIELPYTKLLAKWGYDTILGIPRLVVPGCHVHND